MAAWLSAGCERGTSAADGGRAAEPAAPIPAVEVVQARHGTLPLVQRLTGTVRARGEVAIYPQTSGTVLEVLADNGQAVSRGEPLVRIQAVGSRAQVAQARSALEVARAARAEADANLARLEAQYERNTALADEGLVPVDTVDTLRRQVEAARAAAARAAAEVRVGQGALAERTDVHQQTVVRAPIAGRVGQRNAEVGMRVDDQTALFTIGRLEQVRVEVPVTQEILARVKTGQRVEIGVQGGDPAPIEAEVSRISPFLAAGSYSAEVEVDVPNQSGALVPGMFVTVDIFYGESEQATLVPASAVYDDPVTGEVGVFVATEAPADAATQGGPSPVLAASAPQDQARPAPMALRFRTVEIVAEGPQTTGVRGIDPGAWVVVIGQHLLSAQAGDAPPQGRVRVIAWDRILELQRLQRDDLLRDFMDRQQRLARQRATPGS
jgi:RND family efflux transporter MFP subunit